MNDERSSAPEPPPVWQQRQGARLEAAERRRPRDEEPPLNRFLGGAPGPVFVRLLFVSLIVGAFMMWLDIRPHDIFRGILDAAQRIWAMGFGAVREIADYILVGAVVVVPVWLVLRLLTMRSR